MSKRVKFDFELEFTNGGGMQGQGFRLDIEGDDIADDRLASYIVRDMRLLSPRLVQRLPGAVRQVESSAAQPPERS